MGQCPCEGLMSLHPGTKNGVLASLNAAQNTIANGNTTAACNRLQAVANQIAGQRGKQISVEDANALLAHIVAIRTELGCSPAHQQEYTHA
jgi:hypothetical protein